MYDKFDKNINATPRESARREPALIACLASSLMAPMMAGAAHAAPIHCYPVHCYPARASSDGAVAQRLAQRHASGWSSVILKTTGAMTPTQEARLVSLGGDITRRLPLIQSVGVRVPTRSLSLVAALPFVTHLSLDGAVWKSDEFTLSSSEADQAVAMNSAGKPYQPTGQGVTVAIIDSGVAPSQDLMSTFTNASRILAHVNFVPDAAGAGSAYSSGSGKGKAVSGNLYDPAGHGTHVAGIVAGNGAKSSGGPCFHTFYGVAQQASLVNVRVLDQNGTTTVGTVISGLQWVVAHSSQYNIRVINLSLGHPVTESYTTDPLCQAVEAAWKAGIVVVCAAGNEGRAGTLNDPAQSNEGWGTNYGSIQSPGNDPCIVTVGATKSMDGVRADDRIATYSSRGPSRLDLVLKPDIIAPGNRVISLCANNSNLDVYNGGTNDIPLTSYRHGNPRASSADYFRLSGTSMAAPVVAGAAALLLQADATLTPDTVKARLVLSADKWADPMGIADPLTYGAGYLNIPAALTSAAMATLPALSPTLSQNSDGTLSMVIDPSAWGDPALMSSRAHWGCGLWGTGITDLRAAWGKSVAADRAHWGCGGIVGDQAAWSSTVWADRAHWGCSTGAVDLTSTAITGE